MRLIRRTKRGVIVVSTKKIRRLRSHDKLNRFFIADVILFGDEGSDLIKILFISHVDFLWIYGSCNTLQLGGVDRVPGLNPGVNPAMQWPYAPIAFLH